jgi:hypothetical protein
MEVEASGFCLAHAERDKEAGRENGGLETQRTLRRYCGKKVNFCDSYKKMPSIFLVICKTTASRAVSLHLSQVNIKVKEPPDKNILF